MASATPAIRLGGLAARLVRDGLHTEEQARDAGAAARKARLPLVRHMVQRKLVSAMGDAQAADQEFGVPLLDLDSVEPEPAVVSLVKDKLIGRRETLPLFRRGKRL